MVAYGTYLRCSSNDVVMTFLKRENNTTAYDMSEEKRIKRVAYAYDMELCNLILIIHCYTVIGILASLCVQILRQSQKHQRQKTQNLSSLV